MNNQEEIKYQEALKRVKKIKGFYTHLIVYVVVNIFIVVLNIKNLEPNESYFQFKNFLTLTFWGLGLISHGLSVFLPEKIFTKEWEERKIQEFLEEEKKIIDKKNEF